MPEQDASTRAALLGQLRYLVDEVEMLRHVLPRVPEALQEARPHGDARSLKDTLAHLAHLDAHVRLPVVRGDTAAPVSRPFSPTAPADTLIDALVDARSALVDAAEALDEHRWQTPAGGAPSLYQYLFAVTQEDAEHLRTLTHHLFDAQGLGAAPR